VPADADKAWQVRMWDRFFDHYVHQPMQKIVTDRLRPAGKNDDVGVEEARAQLREAYAYVEQALAGLTWAVGETFSLADCSAAPALFYANTVEPFSEHQPWLAAYNDRLMLRPSYARALTEAEPYFRFFPMEEKPVIKRQENHG
jgi:glutathione S-transferase